MKFFSNTLQEVSVVERCTISKEAGKFAAKFWPLMRENESAWVNSGALGDEIEADLRTQGSSVQLEERPFYSPSQKKTAHWKKKSFIEKKNRLVLELKFWDSVLNSNTQFEYKETTKTTKKKKKCIHWGRFLAEDREESEGSRRRHCHCFYSFFFYKLLVKLIEPTFSEKYLIFICAQKVERRVREKIQNLSIVYPSGFHPVLGRPSFV